MLYSIQFARALAALFVVYFHIAHHVAILPQFGAFGVDVFFVISGFIIAKVASETPQYFFLKRLIRIVPLYWIFTLIVFLVAKINPELFKSTIPTIENLLKSLFFIPYSGVDDIIKPLYFIGWSLNYEMFFYVMSSILLSLFCRGKFHLSITLSLLLVYMFSNLIAPMSIVSRFSGNSLVLEFLIGVLIHKASSVKYDNQNPCFAFVIVILIFSLSSLIYLDWLEYSGLNLFGIISRVIALGIPSGVFIYSILHLEHLFQKADFVRLLGDSTYSIYLIHPILIEAIYFIGLRYLALESSNLYLVVISFFLCLIAGIIVHLYIEKPSIRWVRKLCRL